MGETDTHNNTKHSLQFLDGLRGLAAIYVVIGHARWLLWEGYSRGFTKGAAQYNFIEKILSYFLLLFKYGHEAVLFFFVLSGFVIHLKYARNITTNGDARFNTKDYLFKRIKRIYPPFLASLLLTFILDSIGKRLHYTIYEGTTPYEFINTIITKQHGFINLLGNLIFIENSRVGIWGTNGPSWSLKYEWWFYMLYPLLIYINRKSIVNSLLVVTGLFILGITVFDPTGLVFIGAILKYLAAWWLGVLLADIYTKRIRIKYAPLALFMLLGPLLILAEIKNIHLGYFANDFAWALFFFGLLGFLFYLQEKGFVFNWAKKLQWLGDCSYTLYITHLPILVLLNGIILHYTNNVMPRTLVFILPGVMIAVVFAYLLHFLVEKPFVRKKQY
jgi:peptidoglycan/LPS O-acetylase OafA/YrhL